MKSKILGAFWVLSLGGCAVPLPEDSAFSPASPQAAEAPRHRIQSALRSDETSHAISARLREEHSGTQAPTREESVEGMQHGNMSHGSPGSAPQSGIPAQSYYTCPMHPEVVSDKPGKCPKCGMELVLKR